MNKKKIKQIKNVVKNLKLVRTIEEYLSPEVKTGQEMLDVGIKFVGKTGQPIDPVKKYKGLFTRIRPLNHVDKMKKFYLEHGEENTISLYLDWLDRHHKKMMLKYPNVFNPKKDEPKTDGAEPTSSVAEPAGLPEQDGSQGSESPHKKSDSVTIKNVRNKRKDTP